VLRTLIATYFFLFLTCTVHSQTVWGELFANSQGNEMEQAYQSVASGNQNEFTQTQLIKYVKTLNDYALLHFDELDETFQKKALSHIISTDSLSFYENRDAANWWRSRFIQLIEVMPVYAIQKQASKLSKPIDTLEIQVPGTDKVISVIVNNKIIQGYLMAQGDESTIAERDLRYLSSDELYDLIAYYREEKDLPDEVSESVVPQIAENQDSVSGKTVILADNNSTNTTEATQNNQSNNENPPNNNESNNAINSSNSNTYTTNNTSNNTSNNSSNNSSNTSSNASSSNSGSSNYNVNNSYKEGIAFRVQIAAARRPLNNIELKERYTGSRSPKTFKEEGWIKYYVAETADLNQAKQIKTEPGMPSDAFIMSYYNGKKAPEYLYGNFDPKPVKSDSYVDLAPETTGKKIWVVQIAADQKPLSMAEVRSRYNGNKPIYKISEGPWHRYSIGIFGSFKEANQLRMSCGVSDAFVAAYLNSKRINTWASIKNPGQFSKKPIRYLVQVAASHSKLTELELKERYKGNKELIYFQENGYHKYALGRYKTFREALKEREECGVPDAFIKAYRGNKKVDLLKAKNITDN
jgi:hypothetical protein